MGVESLLSDNVSFKEPDFRIRSGFIGLADLTISFHMWSNIRFYYILYRS